MATTAAGRAALPIGLSAAVLVAACSATPAQPVRSPQASRDLAKALAGYTAGQPVRCIPGFPRVRMQVIDDNTILFSGNRTVYLQRPPGGCLGIGSQSSALVTQTWGVNQLCQGDINRLVDISTGMGGGSCAFGPFVPYTKPS
jgi:hypothetical protein